MKKWIKFLIVFIILLIILCVVLPMIITIICYNSNFGTREEVSSNTFSESDFSMITEEISFKSNNGQTLRGYVYKKNDTYTPKALIVFSHGYLNTHNDYLNQIDFFVQNDFIALAYDNTGCGISAGDNLVGLVQSSLDLKAALDFVHSNEELNKYKLFLYGHSLGGYATCAVLNYDTDVDGVVSLSGFYRSSEMLIEYGKRLYGNICSLLSPYAYIYERIKFNDSAYLDGVRGINNAKDVPVLLMHSSDDDVISLDNSLLSHTDLMLNPARLKTIYYTDKSHNVVKSYDAIKYSNELQSELDGLYNQYDGEIPEDVLDDFYSNQDVSKLYSLDDSVMNSILEFYLDLL